MLSLIVSEGAIGGEVAARETPGTAALPGEAVRRSTETVRSSDFRANVVTKRPFTLRERLLHSLRENFRRVRARPAILLTALLCGVLCAALLAILVEVLRRHQKNVMRDDVRRQAVHAARFVEQLFQQLAMPAQSLSVIVYERPSWPDLEPRLPLLAREILSQPVTRNRAIAEVAQILVLPDGIVSFAYPNDPVLPRALGLDVLDHPVPSARQAAAAARDDRTCALQGPYPFEGESLVVVRCPIFVPISRDGVRLNQDSTRASITGRRYSDVIPPAPGAEHSDAGPVAFWGFTSAALDLERFVDVAIEDSRTIDRHMYRYCVYRPGNAKIPGNAFDEGESGDEDLFVLATEPGLRYESVEEDIQLPHKIWTLQLGLREPFSEAWIVPGFLGAAAIGLLVGALVLLVSLANARHMELLLALLPKHVIRDLHRGAVVAESLPDVTTLFADLVSYTAMSLRMAPIDVLSMLNGIFATFDDLCDVHRAFKLDIIGDAYIAVSGIEPECSDHCACRRHSAAVMAALALDMVDAVRALPPCNGAKIQIRVGLHVGPLVAGVVGSKRPKYTLVGETMNLGSRMESTGEPMLVQVTEAFRDRLEESGAEYVTEPRMVGEQHGVFVKGKGVMRTWWLSRVPTTPSGVPVAGTSGSTLPNDEETGHGSGQAEEGVLDVRRAYESVAGRPSIRAGRASSSAPCACDCCGRDGGCGGE